MDRTDESLLRAAGKASAEGRGDGDADVGSSR